jgi:mannitol operon transcriptional antiterminator
MEFTPRISQILKILLANGTPIGKQEIAEELGVSKATAGSDMDSLCDWLEESHLGIVRRPGYGVILEGDERDYREAMRRFIEETAGHSDAYSSVDITGEIFAEALLDAADSGIYSLLEGDTVRRVASPLRQKPRHDMHRLLESS